MIRIAEVSIVARATLTILRVMAPTAVVLALAGCASTTVSSFLERGADLQRYRTFDFAAVDKWSTGDPRLDNNTVVADRIRSQAESHLAAKGLERSAVAPDVLVRFHLNMSQRFDVTTVTGDPSRGELDQKRPYVFDAGTLVLDLVEPATNKLLWRGWAEGSFEGLVDNQAWLEAHVDSAVQKILARLPRM
jgi:hypothetical protein